MAETDESNNGAVGDRLTFNRDLEISVVSGSISAGSLTYSVTVRNTGNIPTVASTTGLYLSGDATAATTDYKIASLSTVALAPGAEKVFTGTVTLPLSVPAGSYYVAAIADIYAVIKESNTANKGAAGNTVTR